MLNSCFPMTRSQWDSFCFITYYFFPDSHSDGSCPWGLILDGLIYKQYQFSNWSLPCTFGCIESVSGVAESMDPSCTWHRQSAANLPWLRLHIVQQSSLTLYETWLLHYFLRLLIFSYIISRFNLRLACANLCQVFGRMRNYPTYNFGYVIGTVLIFLPHP